MSGSAAELLGQVEREGVPPLHIRRLQHAAAVVRDAFTKAIADEDASWAGWGQALLTAGEAEDWGRIHDLILQGDRRVLVERDPNTKNIRVPRTQEEWGKIPDVLPEFTRRYKIAE